MFSRAGEAADSGWSSSGSTILAQTPDGWRLSADATEYAEALAASSPDVEQLAEREDRRHVADPTKTKTTARKYAQKLRGRFAAIAAQLRRDVRGNDALNLNPNGIDRIGAEGLADDFTPRDVPQFRFETDAAKHDAFLDWFLGELDRGVLQPVRGRNAYVLSAYERGVTNADRALAEQSVAAAGEAVRGTFDAPIHREQLDLLYTRNFEALDGIVNEVAKEVSRELTQGLAAGESPTAVAQAMTDRIEAVGKTRATVLARTEIVESHNAAALRRYEQALGPDAEIEVLAEVRTAQDRRVCPICSPRDGDTMTIAEAKGGAGPLYHPQCRCTVLPRAT